MVDSVDIDIDGDDKNDLDFDSEGADDDARDDSMLIDGLGPEVDDEDYVEPEPKTLSKAQAPVKGTGKSTKVNTRELVTAARAIPPTSNAALTISKELAAKRKRLNSVGNQPVDRY
jgi:hypothetical protein